MDCAPTESPTRDVAEERKEAVILGSVVVGLALLSLAFLFAGKYYDDWYPIVAVKFGWELPIILEEMSSTHSNMALVDSHGKRRAAIDDHNADVENLSFSIDSDTSSSSIRKQTPNRSSGNRVKFAEETEMSTFRTSNETTKKVVTEISAKLHDASTASATNALPSSPSTNSVNSTMSSLEEIAANLSNKDSKQSYDLLFGEEFATNDAVVMAAAVSPDTPTEVSDCMSVVSPAPPVSTVPESDEVESSEARTSDELVDESGAVVTSCEDVSEVAESAASSFPPS